MLTLIAVYTIMRVCKLPSTKKGCHNRPENALHRSAAVQYFGAFIPNHFIYEMVRTDISFSVLVPETIKSELDISFLGRRMKMDCPLSLSKSPACPFPSRVPEVPARIQDIHHGAIVARAIR